MVLRETLKEEIDGLNENQLSQIADYIFSLKTETQPTIATTPFWESASSEERAQDFLEWVARLHRGGETLPDEAFDRGSIYES